MTNFHLVFEVWQLVIRTFYKVVTYSADMFARGHQIKFWINIKEFFFWFWWQKWKFSKPIENPSQIEKMLKYTPKTEKYKKKMSFSKISKCFKIFSRKDINMFDIWKMFFRISTFTWKTFQIKKIIILVSKLIFS